MKANGQCLASKHPEREENLNTGSFSRPKPGAQVAAEKVSTDNGRKWMWWFLVALVATQFYYVHELLGALLLFAMVFAVMVAMVAAAYVAQRAWVASVAGIERTVAPMANASRRGLAFAEDLSRKALGMRS